MRKHNLSKVEKKNRRKERDNRKIRRELKRSQFSKVYTN